MRARTVRATVLGGVGTLLMAGATARLLRAAAAAWPGRGPTPVEDGLAFLTVGAAGLVAAWVCLLLAGATVTLLPSGYRPGRAADVAPTTGLGRGRGLTGRVAALLLVAAGLGAAPAAAEQARQPVVAAHAVSPVVEETQQEGPDEDVGVPVPGWSLTAAVPGWTPTATAPVPEPARRAAAEVGLVSTTVATAPVQEVVVRRGDTLWGIAARHLGGQATDQDVAEAWPRWYAANRDVIGSDPDLIVPGQRLVVPATGDRR